MNMLQLLVLVAIAATIFSLGSGVLAMMRDGEVRHNDSATWMNWRVAAQGIAVALVLAAAYAEA